MQVGGRALTPQHKAACGLMGERLRRMAAHPAGYLAVTPWMVRTEVSSAGCSLQTVRALHATTACIPLPFSACSSRDAEPAGMDPAGVQVLCGAC
jgi:hypothetical protein